MADYIEKDRSGCGCYYDTSATGFPGSDSDTADSAANDERWAWLINGWDKMSFAEKYSLFFQTIHFVNLNQSYPEKMDVDFQISAITFGLENCRNIICFDFENNRINAPQVAVVYSPVYYWVCTNKELVKKIDKFYLDYVYPTMCRTDIDPHHHHHPCDCDQAFDADYLGHCHCTGETPTTSDDEDEECSCPDPIKEEDIYKF